MKRIFHPWDKWEDYTYGFYGGKDFDSKNAVKICANLLKDLNMFEHALARIVIEWPYSCEHNLTNESMNRIAYLGQAAFALLYNIPNNVSMAAYSTLTLEEQQKADALAQKYLDLWLSNRKDINVIA
jgi:hypothetical protein